LHIEIITVQGHHETHFDILKGRQIGRLWILPGLDRKTGGRGRKPRTAAAAA
jgi:hypothetical protein